MSPQAIVLPAPPEEEAMPDSMPDREKCAHFRLSGDTRIRSMFPEFYNSYDQAPRGHEWQVCIKCGDVQMMPLAEPNGHAAPKTVRPIRYTRVYVPHHIREAVSALVPASVAAEIAEPPPAPVEQIDRVVDAVEQPHSEPEPEHVEVVVGQDRDSGDENDREPQVGAPLIEEPRPAVVVEELGLSRAKRDELERRIRAAVFLEYAASLKAAKDEAHEATLLAEMREQENKSWRADVARINHELAVEHNRVEILRSRESDLLGEVERLESRIEIMRLRFVNRAVTKRLKRISKEMSKIAAATNLAVES